ncbi:MAG TPA: phasin family protein [Stellaceae bacterium]|nr:phasin family protein [Stellaceae bacterium]
MSDARAKRPARDAARGDAAAAEPTPPAPDERPADIAAMPVSAAAIPAPPEPVPGPEPARGRPVPVAADDAWTALAEAQSALARACEEIAVEVGGMTRSGIAAGTDAALALLGARTFAEAVEINAGLAQRGFGAIVEGSARLSEIGVKAMTEASRPLVARLSAGWDVAANR